MKIFDILGTKTNLFKKFNILIKNQPKEVLSSFYHFGRLSLEHLGKLGKAERPGNHKKTNYTTRICQIPIFILVPFPQNVFNLGVTHFCPPNVSPLIKTLH